MAVNAPLYQYVLFKNRAKNERKDKKIVQKNSAYSERLLQKYISPAIMSFRRPYPPPAEVSPGMPGIRRGSLPGKLRVTEVDKGLLAFNFAEPYA
jgi:hypothetical protein